MKNLIAFTLWYLFVVGARKPNEVGICQTIGRVTGCAMPELQRRVFAPKNVIDAYNIYNKRQETYIKEFQKCKSVKLTKDIIAKMVFEKSPRRIDREKLNLRINTSDSGYSSDSESEKDRMTDLIDMWWGSKSIIGKILKYIYENEYVNEEELKEYIEQCGSKNTGQMYKHLTTQGKEYNLVFERKNNITSLKQEARNYIG
jgi:hypothetical protein